LYCTGCIMIVPASYIMDTTSGVIRITSLIS
jgi:hypothetical protein